MKGKDVFCNECNFISNNLLDFKIIGELRYCNNCAGRFGV